MATNQNSNSNDTVKKTTTRTTAAGSAKTSAAKSTAAKTAAAKRTTSAAKTAAAKEKEGSAATSNRPRTIRTAAKKDDDVKTTTVRKRTAASSKETSEEVPKVRRTRTTATATASAEERKPRATKSSATAASRNSVTNATRTRVSAARTTRTVTDPILVAAENKTLDYEEEKKSLFDGIDEIEIKVPSEDVSASEETSVSEESVVSASENIFSELESGKTESSSAEPKISSNIFASLDSDAKKEPEVKSDIMSSGTSKFDNIFEFEKDNETAPAKTNVAESAGSFSSKYSFDNVLGTTEEKEEKKDIFSTKENLVSSITTFEPEYNEAANENGDPLSSKAFSPVSEDSKPVKSSYTGNLDNGSGRKNEVDGKKNGKLLILLLVLLVLVGGGVGLGIGLSKKGFSESADKNSANNIEENVLYVDIDGEGRVEKTKVIERSLNYINEEKYDEALVLLEQVIAQYPDDTYVQGLIDRAKKLKDEKEAREEKNSLTPEMQDLLVQAKDNISKGNFDLAIEQLNSILKENPENEEIKNLLRLAQDLKNNESLLKDAKKALQDGRFDDAISLANRILTVNPSDEEAKKVLEAAMNAKTRQTYLDQAKSYIDSKDFDNAINVLNRLVSENPNDQDARNLLERACSLKKDADAKKFAEASAGRNNSAAISSSGTNSGVSAGSSRNPSAGRGTVSTNGITRDQAIEYGRRFVQNGQYDEAINLMKEVLSYYPNDAEAREIMNDAIRGKNRTDSASSAYTQRKTAGAREALANGNYDDAIAQLEALLAQDPNNEEIRRLLSEAMQMKAEKEGASKTLQDQKAAQAMLQAEIERRRQTEAAKAAEEKAAAEKKASEDMAKAEKALSSGNYDDAITQLEALLAKNPNNVEAKRLLDEAKARKAEEERRAAEKKASEDMAKAEKALSGGNYDDAIAQLEALLAKDPNNADVKHLLDEAKAKKDAEEKAKAEEAAKAAVQKKAAEDKANAREALANGKYDDAIAQLEALLAQDPDNAEVKRLLDEAKAKKAEEERRAAEEKAQQEAMRAAAEKKAADEKAKAEAAENARQEAQLKAQQEAEKAAAEKKAEEEKAKAEAAAKAKAESDRKAQEREAKLAQARKDIDAANYDKAISDMNKLLTENANDAQAKSLRNEAQQKKQAQEAAARAEAERKAKEEAARVAAEKKAAEEKAKAEAIAKAKNQAEAEIAKGMEALRNGNIEEAMKHFENAKNLLPAEDNNYSAGKLGEISKALYDAAENEQDTAKKAKLQAEAIAYANESVAKDSNNGDANYVLGMDALERKNYALAEQEFSKAIKQNPNNYMYYYQLGRAQAQQRKYTAAETSFQNSVKLNANFAQAQYNLGFVQERNGKSNAALTSYKNAYKVDPKYERAYLAAGRIMSAKADYNGAAAAFGEALGLNPANAQTYQELGSVYANSGKYALAETNFRKALEYMDPGKKDATTYYNLSAVLSAQEKHAEAIQYAKQSYELKETASKDLRVSIIYNYGVVNEAAGNISAAVALYEEAIEADSKHVNSMINIGALYLGQNNTEQAITYLKKACSVEPKNFAANNNLANAYRASGDLESAAKYYKIALDSNDDPTVRENLAKAYASEGQYEEARAEYEKLIVMDTKRWDAYIELAKVCVSLGDVESARKHLQFLQANNAAYRKSEVQSLLDSLN